MKNKQTKIEEEIGEIIYDLFESGKSYGEDLGYAKDDALYELRTDSGTEAREKIRNLLSQALSSERQRIVEILENKTHRADTTTEYGKTTIIVCDHIIKLIQGER